jgi:hypothetical protein
MLALDLYQVDIKVVEVLRGTVARLRRCRRLGNCGLLAGLTIPPGGHLGHQTRPSQQQLVIRRLVVRIPGCALRGCYRRRQGEKCLEPVVEKHQRRNQLRWRCLASLQQVHVVKKKKQPAGSQPSQPEQWQQPPGPLAAMTQEEG